MPGVWSTSRRDSVPSIVALLGLRSGASRPRRLSGAEGDDAPVAPLSRLTPAEWSVWWWVTRSSGRGRGSTRRRLRRCARCPRGRDRSPRPRRCQRGRCSFPARHRDQGWERRLAAPVERARWRRRASCRPYTTSSSRRDALRRCNACRAADPSIRRGSRHRRSSPGVLRNLSPTQLRSPRRRPRSRRDEKTARAFGWRSSGRGVDVPVGATARASAGGIQSDATGSVASWEAICWAGARPRRTRCRIAGRCGDGVIQCASSARPTGAYSSPSSSTTRQRSPRRERRAWRARHAALHSWSRRAGARLCAGRGGPPPPRSTRGPPPPSRRGRRTAGRVPRGPGRRSGPAQIGETGPIRLVDPAARET